MSTSHNGTATDTMTAIDTLIGRASGYNDAGLGQKGAPTMGVAVLICMDTRIDPAAIFGLNLGEAHVVRCAGALPTPGMVESIAISQEKTGSREVMVVHHTGCAGLATLKPGMTPEETTVETVQHLRADARLPYRDKIRGFVFSLEDGSLTEVHVPATPAPSSNRHRDRSHGRTLPLPKARDLAVAAAGGAAAVVGMAAYWISRKLSRR
jgi:carbonic anhydrase